LFIKKDLAEVAAVRVLERNNFALHRERDANVETMVRR